MNILGRSYYLCFPFLGCHSVIYYTSGLAESALSTTKPFGSPCKGYTMYWRTIWNSRVKVKFKIHERDKHATISSAYFLSINPSILYTIIPAVARQLSEMLRTISTFHLIWANLVLIIRYANIPDFEYPPSLALRRLHRAYRTPQGDCS